jgi:hypothetical protein
MRFLGQVTGHEPSDHQRDEAIGKQLVLLNTVDDIDRRIKQWTANVHTVDNKA